MAALARENPSLSPGALFAAGSGGIAPGTPASRALGEGDRKVKSEQGGIKGLFGKAYRGAKAVGSALLPDAVGNTVSAVAPGIKGTTRGVTGLLAAPGEAIQATFRDSAADGDIQASEWINWVPRVFANFDKTSAGQLTKQIGEKGLTGLDTGNGFFLGGQVTADQRRLAYRQANMQINGKGRAVTVGRYFANSIGLEPGNKAFNIVSGLADASVNLGSDPSSFAGAPTKALQARRLFAGDASKGFDAAGVAAKIDSRLTAAGVAAVPARSADDIADDMGAVRGIRDTVNSDRVLEWLTTKKEGQQLVSYLAKETDFAKVYDATKGKIDPSLILEMTKREMSADEIIQILGPQLGRTAQTESKFGLDAVAKADLGVGGLGTVATATFKRRVRDTRMFGTVPERVLPKNDLNAQLENANNFMRNAKIDPAERSAIFVKLTEANGGAGMYDATRQMMVLGMERAVEGGIPRDKATKLFQIYEDSESGRRKYWQQMIGKEGERRWVNKAFNATEDDLLDDKITLRAMPHLASQFLDNNIPLPDPRAIRAEISRYKGVLNLPLVQPGKMALEKISDNIFKPGVLLRPAYIARNQIDEQFRPAGVGLDSLFSHPVSYLQWVMSDQANVGKFLSKATGGQFKSRGATFGPDGQFFDENAVKIREAETALKEAKATGDQAIFDEAKVNLKAAKEAIQSVTPFTDGVSQYVRSVTGGLGNWRNRSFAQANGDDLYQRSDTSYSRAMGEGLHRIFNDPIAKQIAAGVDINDIKGQFRNGNLKGFRDDLAKQGDRMSYLNDPIGADQYIDDTVEFVKTFVGDSVELRQAAATGRINGKALTAGDTLNITKEALDEFDALKQIDGFQGPDAIIGSTVLRGGGDDAGMWTKAVDFMFYQIADRPTRYLTKSPVFRQRYYKRMENMIGFMEPKAAQDLIESARVANLKPKDIKRLQNRVKPGGTLTFEEADLVGKTDALEFTSNLLYDLHNRSQFFDVTRLLFPFGEAFKDSAVRYSQIVGNNPVLPYRLGQVITGGRETDLNGDGEGFFYTDEQTGEEMFAFPGSDTLLDAVGLEGAGKLRAPVKNLNILGTTVIPGFGPTVQIAAASILPDEPDFNAVRSFVSPYGDRTLDGGALESFLPSWFAKWRTAELVPFLDANPRQVKAFANAQKDMMGYLASTGDYDMQTPEGIQTLQDDAKTKARALFFIRGMAQAFAPSPPSPEFVAYDKDGRLQTQFRLAEEYRKIQEEQKDLGTPEATNRVFIETFGEGAVLAVIPNTKQAQDQSPVAPTKTAYEFYQGNKKAAERFPTVFGLFAPEGDGEDFDFVAYQQQLDSGQREVITPDEAVRRANQRLGRMVYENAQNRAGKSAAEASGTKWKPTTEQKQALGDLKALLAEDYPGYSASFSNDTPKLLEDLKRAAVDPTLAKTKAGQGLEIWLKARDAAEAGAQAQFGVSWKQADRSRPIRDAMRALAENLGQDFPGFTNIYERALEREMTRD